MTTPSGWGAPAPASTPAPGLAWAAPALLRALDAGHPAQRARALRLLGTLDRALLEADPIAAALRRHLAGDDADLSRRAGALVAARGLQAFGPDLVQLLRGPRRDDARRWLRTKGFPRPVAALLRLALEPAVEVGARREALRLLEGEPLSERVRSALVVVFAERELQPAALDLLRPHASDELVAAAVVANAAFGAALDRKRRLDAGLPPGPTGLEWLLDRVRRARVSPLGVHRDVEPLQRDFLRGIARLAVAARSPRWLTHFAPWVDEPSVGPALVEAWLGLEVTAVGEWALGELLLGRTSPARLRLLGALAKNPAALTSLETRALPAFDEPADAIGQAAILAAAKLRARSGTGAPVAGSLLARLLDGALLGMRRDLLGEAGGPNPAVGHMTTWAAALGAGVELQDPRFARLALDLLAAPRGAPELLEEAVPDALAALARGRTAAAVDVVPALRHGLEKGVPEHAVRWGLEAVRRGRLLALAPAVVHAVRSPARAAAATRAFAALLVEPQDVEAARGPAPPWGKQPLGALALDLVKDGPTGDEPLVPLLERLRSALPAAAWREVAAVVVERATGAKALRVAFAALEEDPDPARRRALAVKLLGSGSGPARTLALEACVRLKLLTDPQVDLALPLARLAADALEQHPTAPWARRQVTLLLDALAPKAGVPGALTREAADLLRERFRSCHAWSSAASFHALHREALDLARSPGGRKERPSGVDLGPLHGGLLTLLSRRTLQHPKTGQKARYEGPLPRFEQALAASAPVVEGLYDLVASSAYRRTGRALLALLGASRARAREGALGLLDREVALANAEAVLARLDDPVADVRAAAVALLDRHELARFAPSLRPRLDDQDPRVRLAAARTLARFGDRSCVARLVEFLGASDVQLRREAVTHLRGYAPEELSGLLAPLVTLEGPLGAAAALAALPRGLPPGDEPLKDAVLALAAKGTGPLRAAALGFLPALCEGEQHGARRLAAVVPLLADPSPEVRAAAAHVLRRRDGRKHAPTIAALAVSLPDAGVRAELLALLADLDVPDAARALLPLLLDPDGRVRAGTRVAARRARGFSLVAELDAVLKKGVTAGAPTDALAELATFLDHVGGEDAAPALADALRCEARPVWEAVLAAARTRGTDLHGGRLVELLKAARPLAPALLPLAVSEVARLQRREGRAEVERVLSAGPTEVARRAALEAAVGLGADAGALARQAEDAAVKRLAAVRGTKTAKDRKTARATLPEQVAARATVAAARRVTIEAAASADALGAALARGDGLWARALGTSPLAEAVGGVAVGTSAAQADVVPTRSAVAGAAFARAAALTLARPGDGLPRSLASGLEAVAVPDPRARIAWRLRDLLPPPAWRAAVQVLGPESGSPTAFALELALTLSKNGAGEAGDEAAVRALLASAKRRAAEAKSAWAPEARARGQVDDLVVGLAEHARPSLAGLVPELVADATTRAKAHPNEWQRGNEASAAIRRWGHALLRLGVPAAHEALAPLAELVEANRMQRAGDDPWGVLLAATGDVARLQALAKPGSAQAGSNPRWGERVALLGEVGGPAAARALLDLLGVAEAGAERPAAQALAAPGEGSKVGTEVRVAVASAAALLGPPGTTLADPILTLLLKDPSAPVLVAALRAVEALKALTHADAVVRLLGHAATEVQAAACAAAQALKLDRARDGLLLLVDLEGGKPAQEVSAKGHAVVLVQAGPQLIHVIKRIRELAGVGLADAKRLAETPGSVIQSGLGSYQASQLAGELRQVGATVEVREGAAVVAAGVPNEVRGAAVRALLALATPGLAEGKTVDRCLSALRTAQPALAEGLARLLVRACPVERLDEVGALLGDPSGPSEVGARLGALRVLGRRGHKAALPVIRALVEDKQLGLELRSAACAALADLEDLASLPMLDALFAATPGTELRPALLEARARLVKRKDGAAAARAVLLVGASGAHDPTARAAFRGLATSVPRDGDEVMARRLLQLAPRGLAPELALDGPGAPHEETPAELLVRAARARVVPQAEQVDALARAIVAQGDPASTARLAALVAARVADTPNDPALPAILGRVAAALPRGDAWPLTRALREPRGGHVPPDVWRELLVAQGRLDPVGAAARAAAALREERSHQAARHRADLVRLVAAAFARDKDAWAPWLRQELASSDATARRAARAALEPGRFPALQGPPAAWRESAGTEGEE